MEPKERAWLALEGVSVGDTFGERFFGPPEEAFARIAALGQVSVSGRGRNRQRLQLKLGST